MGKAMLIYILLWCCQSLNGIRFTLDAVSDLPLLIKDGKEQFELITAKKTELQYGSCWSNAVSALEVGCRALTQDMQSLLALRLTDCFLQMSGQPPITCETATKNCLGALTDRQFNAFTEFFTHSINICYFLQSKLWHEESENTIDRLASTSFKVSLQLEAAEKGQESLLKQQQESLSLQGKMAENMESSRDIISTMMQELRITAMEHQMALTSLFQQLALLQSWMVGELSWLDSIVFYSSSVLLSCVFTSTVRTRRARLPVLLVLTATYGFERFLYSFLDGESPETLPESRSFLSTWIWVFRKASICVCILILIVMAITHYDYDAVNYEMLLQIRRQNLEIQSLLQRLRQCDFVDGAFVTVKTESEKKNVGDFSDMPIILQEESAPRSEVVRSSATPSRDSTPIFDIESPLEDTKPRRSRRIRMLQ